MSLLRKVIKGLCGDSHCAECIIHEPSNIKDVTPYSHV